MSIGDNVRSIGKWAFSAGKGRVSTRGLSDVDIEWEEWKGKEKGGLTPDPSPKGEGSKEGEGPVVG